MNIPPEKPQSRRARFAEKCVTAACCAALGGCAGAPPVRPDPKPEACPPTAVATMKELGIRIGDTVIGAFPVQGGSKPVPVKEFTPVTLRRELGKLQAGTVLSGRLILGEGRIYGRFTQARTLGGKTYPVCVELWSHAGGLGVDRKDEGGPADSAVVFSSQRVRAVERFE